MILSLHAQRMREQIVQHAKGATASHVAFHLRMNIILY